MFSFFYMYIPRNGIATSCGAPVLTFWGTANLFFFFKLSGYTSLHSYHLLFSFFWLCYPKHVWSSIAVWFWLTFPNDYDTWSSVVLLAVALCGIPEKFLTLYVWGFFLCKIQCCSSQRSVVFQRMESLFLPFAFEIFHYRVPGQICCLYFFYPNNDLLCDSVTSTSWFKKKTTILVRRGKE